ncbi:hypothetical protein EDB92DRAFT_1943852 [Lactarius akahatsu]|uniref:Uncharacterized protein n=1 Tax=Lactarius akahatsu TaxID=416441 RepID=A0AAD4LKS5_9AGAM|nr:hypothetical protein EDB92DRAFT_1943852 [Lactarius akahatsu]
MPPTHGLLSQILNIPLPGLQCLVIVLILVMSSAGTKLCVVVGIMAAAATSIGASVASVGMGAAVTVGAMSVGAGIASMGMGAASTVAGIGTAAAGVAGKATTVVGAAALGL